MEVGRAASPLGAMDSLVVLAGLIGVPLPIARGLEELGWNVQRLGTLDDKDEEMIAAVLKSLEDKLGMGVDAQPLLGLVEVAAKAAEVSWRVEGNTSGAELLVAHEAKKLQDKMNEWRTVAESKLREAIPRRGTAKVVRWPTRLQKKLQEIGTDDQRLRDKVEREERARWVRELRQQLIDGDCPAVRDEGLCRDLTRRFGKGRRASTLRKHVKTWDKLSLWMLGTFRHRWPESPAEVCRYLECLADEPCGRTIPNSIYKTLMFMENAGEVEPDKQLWRSPAIKNVLEEINMQLGDKGGGFVKRAWHLPVRIIMELEEVVMTVEASAFARCYAWFRLIKLWTGMRFSDTCGLAEGSMELHTYGWTAVLTRTKTSGPGKRVVHLRVWVHMECWIRKVHWLETGYDLWKRLGREANLLDRDFGLPCPSRDMDGFTKRIAGYSIASRCSQALFGDLMMEYEGGVIPVLAEGVGLVWTEHSERATMRTWAEAAGISEPIRKQMGRWVPATDQVYERTGRTNVLQAQCDIATFVKEQMGKKDPFDESLVFAAIAERMAEDGYPQGAIDHQIDKLRMFGREDEAKRPRLRENTEMIVTEDTSDDGWELVRAKAGDSGKERSQPDVESVASEDGEVPLGDASAAVRLPTHGTYVLSVIGRSCRKTLHRVGECHRIPGIHYRQFEVVGDEPPHVSQFHQSCSICFPRGTKPEEGSSGDADDEDVSSSDSSTSFEETEEEDRRDVA